jgi:hypothetical protein
MLFLGFGTGLGSALIVEVREDSNWELSLLLRHVGVSPVARGRERFFDRPRADPA